MTVDAAGEVSQQVRRPLLLSAVLVAEGMSEMETLMRDLPDFASRFIQFVCSVLTTYRENCHEIYKRWHSNNSRSLILMTS